MTTYPNAGLIRVSKLETLLVTPCKVDDERVSAEGIVRHLVRHVVIIVQRHDIVMGRIA